jgi:hypothetical protein
MTSSIPRERAALIIRCGLIGDLRTRRPRDTWFNAKLPRGLDQRVKAGDIGASGAIRCRWSGGQPICRPSSPSGSAISFCRNSSIGVPEIRRTSSPTSQPNVSAW